MKKASICRQRVLAFRKRLLDDFLAPLICGHTLRGD